MQSHFQQCLDRAGRRTGAALLLDRLGLVLLVAGLVFLAAMLVERAFALPLVTWQTGAGLAGAAAVTLAIFGYLARPTRMQVALAIDERMALRERFSTTLALAASQDPFAMASRQEAYRRTEGLDISPRFPICLNRRWAWAACGWAAAGLVAVLMPPLDLLGRQAAANLLAADRDRARQAAAEVQRTASRVEAMVKQLNLPDVAADVAQLGEFKPEASAEDIRREAIRKMGDVADRLQELGAGQEAQATAMLEQMMKQLRLPVQGAARKFAQALARGRYSDAAEALRQMREQMDRGEMKPEDRAALARDLEKLARQLDAVAQRSKDLEDALAAAGVDRNLAALSPDALRQALEKAGVDSATIQKLLQKQQAARLASEKSKSLASALSKCSGAGAPGGPLSPDAMAAAEGQLSELEAMRDQMALLQAALDELRAGAGGTGDLLGGLGLFAPQGAGQGMGTGQRGRGFGPNPTTADTPTSAVGTRVKGQNKPGSVIATWYTQEDQVTGEAKREFQEALQAGKDRAAEAVSENVIPARYHETVKRYFETVGKSDAEKAAPSP